MRNTFWPCANFQICLKRILIHFKVGSGPSPPFRQHSVHVGCDCVAVSSPPFRSHSTVAIACPLLLCILCCAFFGVHSVVHSLMCSLCCCAFFVVQPLLCSLCCCAFFVVHYLLCSLCCCVIFVVHSLFCSLCCADFVAVLGTGGGKFRGGKSWGGE